MARTARLGHRIAPGVYAALGQKVRCVEDLSEDGSNQNISICSAGLIDMIVRTLGRRKELLENLALIQRQILQAMQLEWLATVGVALQRRQSWIQQMDAVEQAFTVEEDTALNTGLELVLMRDKLVRATRTPVSARNAKSSNSISTMRTSVDQDLSRRRFVCKANAVVRTSPHHLAAYLCTASSQHMQPSSNAVATVTSEVIDEPSDHSAVVFDVVKSAFFQSRTFLTLLICKKMSDSPLTYVCVGVPLLSHALVTPEREKTAVRAELFRCFRLTASEEDPDTTNMEYAAWIDFKGTLPASVLSSVVISQLIDLPYQMQACIFGCLGEILRLVVEPRGRQVGRGRVR